jgi:signal transduction histidine kinase
VRSGLRVLIAEDDPASAELAEAVLEDLDCVVVGSVTSGGDAVEAVVRLEPELVLMDLAMPGMDGVEATRRITELHPTPVVALTAFESRDWVERACAAGVGAYLVKPLKARELERAVEVALARFGDMRELRRLILELERAEADRRELESQVRQVQKLESLAVLAGGVAHDFNNLLTSLLGNLELALLRTAPDAPSRRHLERIGEAARRAAELSQQMLAFSGRGNLMVQEADLSALVRDHLGTLRSLVPTPVSLSVELGEGLPRVRADVGQLRQLVRNLVVNAVEAVGGVPGRVTVATSACRLSREELRRTLVDDGLPPGEYVALEVTDTGAGMDAATLARVFDPFFSTKFTGRGLGLAVVLGIVRGHRGAIRVASEVGRGSTVAVLLPALSVWASGTAPGGPGSPIR